jgi:hypothetical protein
MPTFKMSIYKMTTFQIAFQVRQRDGRQRSPSDAVPAHVRQTAHRGQGVRRPGPNAAANPTIVTYNASVANYYNATGSLARLENKNI